MRTVTLKNGWCADACLAVLVALIISMMIVPLPTPLLDIMIVGNISIGVLMLLVGMIIPNGLAFAAMPTVLLVTTLYRLAINISSTRLILLQAYAGQVINSFGEFVVRGDYIVGAVIFLIITVVQYLVIARGSERVAEVGARFTLDAMPGKQMAIDADLRSGAITSIQATKQRRQLQRESQFYGAMDGAMKFVKGDAVASIFISLVNIIAGVGVGVGTGGMELSDSLQVYGLLTVGDGLVSQIPSLLISTSAGVVVTKVASEQENRSLGADIGYQLFGNPRVLIMCSFFLALLAVVPGIPAIPFLFLAVILGVAAQILIRLRGKLDKNSKKLSGQQPTQTLVPEVTPVSIELGGKIARYILDDNNVYELVNKEINSLRERLFVDLGVTLPEVRFRISSDLDEVAYRLALKEIPMGQGTVKPRRPERHSNTNGHELESCTYDNTIQNHKLIAHIDKSLEKIGSSINSQKKAVYAKEIIVHHLEKVVRSRAQDLVGIQETQSMLDQLEKSLPALIHDVMPNPVTLSLLTNVLRRLVKERVSIRPLKEILEALSIYAPLEKDVELLTENVRSSLMRHITYRYAISGELDVHQVDPGIEEVIRDAMRKGPKGYYLALKDEERKDIIDAIRRVCADEDVRLTPILLTQSDIRRFVKKLIATELPEVEVMSYAELAPEIIIRPLERIELRM